MGEQMTEDEPLSSKIVSWLEKEGYPLELRVARALAERDVPYAHARYYDDPETGTRREIDLVAYFDQWDEPRLSVHLAIECKAPSKPWLLFTTEQIAMTPEGYVSATPATTEAKNWLHMISGLREVQETPLFRRPERVGFNLVQALGGTDAAYTAIMSATKAAVALAEAATRNNHSVVFVPVIVVGCPLFEANLDTAGDITLNPIDYGKLLRMDLGQVVLHVVTEQGLASFIDDCARSIEVVHAGASGSR